MKSNLVNGLRGLRGGTIRPTRLSHPTLRFWWPVVALSAFTGTLWLMLPHGKATPRVSGARWPEPGAAYVSLAAGAQSIYLKQDLFTSPSGLGFGRSLAGVSAREMTAPPPRPLPEILPLPAPEAWSLAAPRPWQPRTPRLKALPPPPETPAAVPSREVQKVLSSGLRAVGFSFDLPRAALPDAPGSARCHLELDENGRVIHLLIEQSDPPADMRALREAISRGRATAGPARGRIDLTWQP
jgi:hypothetical protein